MKKFLVIILTVVSFLFAGQALAKSNPSVFLSKDGCTQALVGGNYTPYEPKFFGLSKKNLTDGKTSKVAKIEDDGCFLMLTTAGKKWVVQKDGTKFRFKLNADGNLATIPYALDVCGNPVYDVVYASSLQKPPAPVKPVAVKAVESQPAPQPVTPQPVARNQCASGGVYGVDQDGRPYCDYPQQEVKASSYGWVPWAIGSGVLAVIVNRNRHGGGPPGVVTRPPSAGAPGVLTLPAR